MVEEMEIFVPSPAPVPIPASVSASSHAVRHVDFGKSCTQETSSPVIVIGKFDGAHLGHRVLANTARQLASDCGGHTLALTFEPHPTQFFSPDIPFFRLNTAAQREERLKAIGFDALAILTFDKAFAALAASEFIEGIVCAQLGARAVVVGEDFRFGAGRSGNAEFIMQAGQRLGFATRIIAPERLASGEIISSSAIRAHLAAGRIDLANAMLGYPYRIEGEVLHGAKIGRTLGYPTANLKPDPGCGLRHGIYAVRVRRGLEWHLGVASFGRRPSFDNGAPLLETYLFEFNASLYGETLGIEVHAYLRDELKFDALPDLIAQMHRDSENARAILARLP